MYENWYVYFKKMEQGFTLLEMMVSVTIIAVALTAVLGIQSRSISIASEAKFSITASLLAQGKMAEMEINNLQDLVSDSGDFGEDYPGYTWQLTVNDALPDSSEYGYDNMKQIDLSVSWGEDAHYRYHLRLYRFLQEDL